MPIEDLNLVLEEQKKRLRTPAAEGVLAPEQIDVDYSPRNKGEQNLIFNSAFAGAMEPDPDNIERVKPNTGGSQVVGGVAPDYSGYEELLKETKSNPGREPGIADLITMAIPTALGAAYGQVGAGAKVGGDWGVKRAGDFTKRQDSMEDTILKLKLARAQQQAKGLKGTKAGGGGTSPTERTWVDREWNTRFMKYQDRTGAWIKSHDDPIIRKAPVQESTRYTPEGGKVNVVRSGNLEKSGVGRLNPAQELRKDANGSQVPYNKYAPMQGAEAERFSKTAMDLTPNGRQAYMALSAQHSRDPAITGASRASEKLKTALSLLAKKDPTPEELTAATQIIAIEMDNGRALSNNEFDRYADANRGFAAMIDRKLMGLNKGDVGLDAVRQSIANLGTSLLQSVERQHTKKTAEYNSRLEKNLKGEKIDGLMFPGLSSFSGKAQTKIADQAEKLSGELITDKPVKKVIKHKNGRNYEVIQRWNPSKKSMETLEVIREIK